MKFSSTLKELREQNHITQNQLASHLKLSLFGNKRKQTVKIHII